MSGPAVRSPELEVIGLTSLFGNVRTTMATRNALYVLEKFGRPDIPVVEGSLVRVCQYGDNDETNLIRHPTHTRTLQYVNITQAWTVAPRGALGCSSARTP